MKKSVRNYVNLATRFAARDADDTVRHHDDGSVVKNSVSVGY